MARRSLPCALTIAGSDSGGGAGVEADLKTFAALQVYGTCVITAVTAQNTQSVYDIHSIPAEIVRKQLEAVLSDIPIKSAKTGMLYSKEVVETVANLMGKTKIPLVVDPIFKAGSGALLMSKDAQDALIKTLLPKALIVTPNLPEAEEIAGIKIKSIDDMKKAGEIIFKLGPKAVVVKGGHLAGETVTDLFYSAGTYEAYTKRRVETKPHGAGCTFSAAIAAFLARDLTVKESVEAAEKFMEPCMIYSLDIGKGGRPVHQMAKLYNEAERLRTIEDVRAAVEKIEASPELLSYIAGVGTQVAMALPYASSKEHVAAVKGRIVKSSGRPKATGPVEFGVSDHMASIILTAMKYDPTVRASLNLHYVPELINAFRGLGYMASSFSRQREPKEIKMIEGGTLSWGTKYVIEKLGKVPDAIFDTGEPGKEPMIRVLGKSATEAVKKALAAVRDLNHPINKRIHL